MSEDPMVYFPFLILHFSVSIVRPELWVSSDFD
jgi:hypothetical protein